MSDHQTEDSLAEVIAAVVDDDMWENRHRPLFAPRTARAVRAAGYKSPEEIEAAIDLIGEKWLLSFCSCGSCKAIRAVLRELRPTLLGATKEVTDA